VYYLTGSLSKSYDISSFFFKKKTVQTTTTKR
jgi:hypothetical protein